MLNYVRNITAQPATKYYAWQVEVMLDNQIELGYNGNHIDVLAAFDDHIPDEWIKLQSKYPFVRFFFYKNTQVDCNYPPAIQAHILAKHFKTNPELQNEAIFFHDCDFLFTKYFDFTPYLRDDNWYFSNTDSYIGADYIESKGSRINDNGDEESILDGMAKAMDLCACIVRARRGRSGGAQKLMKNVSYDYWEQVEHYSIKLYNWLKDHKDEYAENNDIQIWTASMWAELWEAWRRGVNVMIPMEFDFSWATCHVSKWSEKAFFHNAGVTSDKHKMFFKAAYTKELPYGRVLDIDPERCSSKYWEQVQKTAEKSVLI